MNARVICVAAVVGTLALAGCAKHDAESLRASFGQQVASIALVREFQRNGDTLTFHAPDATGSDAQWRVHIDSVIVEHNDDKMNPFRGTITSSWFMNGASIEAATLGSHLPKGFKEKGISENSSAVWEGQRRQWNW